MHPLVGKGVEIGVSTGRFAEPLGIEIGVEPSKRMRETAKKRGIQVVGGIPEKVPFDKAGEGSPSSPGKKARSDFFEVIKRNQNRRKRDGERSNGSKF